MTNIEKYKKIFCETFKITEDKLDLFKYQDNPEWDSVGHMFLIDALEKEFDIMMDAEDIINLSSYKKGIDILRDSYQIDI